MKSATPKWQVFRLLLGQMGYRKGSYLPWILYYLGNLRQLLSESDAPLPKFTTGKPRISCYDMIDACIYFTRRQWSRILYKSLFLLYFLISESWSQKDDLIATLKKMRSRRAFIHPILNSVFLHKIRVSNFIWKAPEKWIDKFRLPNSKIYLFLLLTLCLFFNLADTPVHAVAHWPVRFIFFGVIRPCDRVLLLQGVASTRLESC